MRLFLRVRAVVKFVLRAASTVENTDCELGALRKFSARRNLSFIKRKRFAPSNLGWLSTTDPSSSRPLRQVASRELGTLGGRSRRSKAF